MTKVNSLYVASGPLVVLIVFWGIISNMDAKMYQFKDPMKVLAYHEKKEEISFSFYCLALPLHSFHCIWWWSSWPWVWCCGLSVDCQVCLQNWEALLSSMWLYMLLHQHCHSLCQPHTPAVSMGLLNSCWLYEFPDGWKVQVKACALSSQPLSSFCFFSPLYPISLLFSFLMSCMPVFRSPASSYVLPPALFYCWPTSIKWKFVETRVAYLWFCQWSGLFFGFIVLARHCRTTDCETSPRFFTRVQFVCKGVPLKQKDHFIHKAL